MKRTTLFIILLFAGMYTYGQINFQDHIIVGQTVGTNNARSVHSADLDGDGDLDVLSASSGDDKISWFENMDGLGNYGSQQVITADADNAFSVYAADLDGDGDIDVISSSPGDDKLAWYENTDGFGTFGNQQIISIVDGAFSVTSVDIDNDGDMDILSESQADDEIIWFENMDGMGNFGNKKVIASGIDRLINVVATDIDDDGNIDVLFSSRHPDDKIAWFRNTDGQGNFGTQQVITTDAFDGQWVASSDIDADGDVDIVSSNGGKIVLYYNTDGLGNFGPQQVLSTTDGVGNVYAFDLDGDNDMDILSTSFGQDKLMWYENTDGLGGFGAEQVITTNADGVLGAYVSDLDGDNDLDVLSASSLDGKVAWYENLDGAGSYSVEQIISETITEINGPYSVRTADIDGDGDLDALSSSTADGKIAWYENMDGVGSFGTPKIISSTISSPFSVHSEDIDGDGDMDVLSASHSNLTLVWYENLDSLGNFDLGGVISTDEILPFSVYSVDIDNDGDQDVLCASQGGAITWYKNSDGLGNFGSKQVINDNAPGASSVYAVDIDNDGDQDVLSASPGNNTIAWYENTDGQGGFSTIKVVSTNVVGPFSVHSADLDGDGDMDILSASQDDKKVAWYENTNGLGDFGAQQIITIEADGATSVYTTDIDGDGDMDVLSASINDDKIELYENTDGLGNFGVPQIIDGDVDFAYSVYAADIDDDGDMDVLSAAAEGDQIKWYENIGESLLVNDFTLSKFSIYPNPVSSNLIIKGNSVIDILSVYDINGRLLRTYENHSSELNIDIGSLSKGIYLIEIKSKEVIETKKLIKN